MKLHSLVVLLLSALFLGACSPPEAPEADPAADDAPVATLDVVAPTTAPTEPAPPTMETIADPPTEAPVSEDGSAATLTTYRDESHGFAFDHPADWSIGGLSESHSRGDLAQLVREDEVMLDIAVLRWDPVGDLTAYLDARKTAWESSGIEILSEEPLPLGADEAVLFALQGPDGAESANYVTVVGERYLSLSGKNVDAIGMVARSVRLLDDAAEGDEAAGSAGDGATAGDGLATAIDCRTPDPASLDYVACNMQDAIRASNLYAAEGYMTDPFGLALWRSEGTFLAPAEAVAQMDANLLPEDRSAITFEADPAAFPDMDGLDPAAIVGPEIDLRLMLYSQGWGPDGQGEAILYFIEGEEGYRWHSLLLAGQGFDF